MTQSDWLTCADPQAMLHYLYKSNGLPDRKARLFSVACCQRLWNYLDDCSRDAVRVMARFADGFADERERQVAEMQATAISTRLTAAWRGSYDEEVIRACAAAAVLNLTVSREEELRWAPYGQFVADQVVGFVLLAEWTATDIETDGIRPERQELPGPAICDLVRDIFHPFHMPSLDQGWLNSNVVSIARDVYERQDFKRMSALAIFLEEAGCTDIAVLDHCRGTGSHYRGCWVLDHILRQSLNLDSLE